MTLSIRISSSSEDETRRIGEIIGEEVVTGVIIALEGDLGSGKTALVQGLARGLEVPQKYYVTSPSYTLMNEYRGRLSLFHLDLYRLSDLDFEDIGLYDILDMQSAVVAIEWAERIAPDNRIECLAIQMEITGELKRNIVFTADGDRQIQLLARLKHRLKETLWH